MARTQPFAQSPLRVSPNEMGTIFYWGAPVGRSKEYIERHFNELKAWVEKKLGMVYHEKPQVFSSETHILIRTTHQPDQGSEWILITKAEYHRLSESENTLDLRDAIEQAVDETAFDLYMDVVNLPKEAKKKALEKSGA